MADQIKKIFDNVTFTLRTATQAEWESSESILDSGEPGFASDTLILKFGDGVNKWIDLKSVSEYDHSRLETPSEIIWDI
jgi:hypothetical protein